MSVSRSEITRVASYGIIEDGEYLLLCRLSSAVGDYAGWWALPGGGLDFGEHPEAGMVREVEEETGLLVRPAGLLGIDSLNRETENDSFHGIRIIYRAEVTGGELRYEAEGTTDMCQWQKRTLIPALDRVSLVDAALNMAGL